MFRLSKLFIHGKTTQENKKYKKCKQSQYKYSGISTVTGNTNAIFYHLKHMNNKLLIP